MINSSNSFNFSSLLQQVQQLKDRLRIKIRKQGRVLTYYDKFLLNKIKLIQEGDFSLPATQLYSEYPELQDAIEELTPLIENQERYVDYAHRFLPKKKNVKQCVLSPEQIIYSQGVKDCLYWKTLPLFKSAYDFCIIPMLIQNIKPRTIIEFGSGKGGSAIWMADLLQIQGIEGQVFSIDKTLPDLTYKNVTFIKGDVNDIEQLITKKQFKTLPHPWLIIEDVHVNLYNILCYLLPELESKDYLMIEDSRNKKKELGRFLMENPKQLVVDTYYTDFFGRNSTSAQNSIFVKL